ncbi:MAG: hypothetical protein LC118_02290 [Dehalococcoidia bacterium]|nr:hypothetical protein [Dehalococcoidia bacterium]
MREQGGSVSDVTVDADGDWRRGYAYPPGILEAVAGQLGTRFGLEGFSG